MTSCFKRCVDCGVDISSRGRAAKRCKAHQIVHRLAMRRSWSNRNLDCRYKRDKEAKARYMAKHRDRHREATRRWTQRNHERYLEMLRNNKARRRGNVGHVTSGYRKRLLTQQGYRCAASWCRSLVNERTCHVDHIFPFALGGLHDDANLQVLCKTCNMSKSDKHPDDWQREHGARHDELF